MEANTKSSSLNRRRKRNGQRFARASNTTHESHLCSSSRDVILVSFVHILFSPSTTLNKPQKKYSGIRVYQIEIRGVHVMRRCNDGWLNATQILRVAGVQKKQRIEILAKRICTTEHEKVQGGHAQYQGTWINYASARELCREYKIEEELGPILHDKDALASSHTQSLNKEELRETRENSRNGESVSEEELEFCKGWAVKMLGPNLWDRACQLPIGGSSFETANFSTIVAKFQMGKYESASDFMADVDKMYEEVEQFMVGYIHR